MWIGIDRHAIVTKDSPIIELSKKEKSSGFSSNAVDKINGVRIGREIFISPSTTVGYISVYLHEVGHVLGDRLSFQAGNDTVKDSHVLSFDEVKKPTTVITLSDSEVEFLKQNIFNRENIKYTDEITSIITKLLSYFTKGSFDPNEINAHEVTQEHLEELVSEDVGGTLSKATDGKVYAVNSKSGRNEEIPAYVTEFCCMQILQKYIASLRYSSC